MASSFAPFRHRDFALFWAGAFVSNIGTWMETVALGYYVAHRTHEAQWSGIIAAAGFLPIALVGPIGGALADRRSRRWLLLTTTLVQTAIAFTITVLTAVGSPPPGVVALVAFGGGCASALGFPAYQAMLPDLVPPEDLVAAVGLGSAQWNLGRIVGPAMAGVVISLGGISWALAINTASFLAVVAVLLVIALPDPAPSPPRSLLGSVRDGVRIVRTEPGLRVALQLFCLNTLVAAPFIALLPAVAVKVLHGGEATTAVLVTAQGVGAVAMALALGPLTNRLGSRRMVLATMAVLGPALVAYGASPTTAVMAVALVVVGGAYLGALSSFTTIAQQRAPAEARGRVLSVNNLVLGSLYPIGSLLQGRIGDLAGLRATTAGAGIVLAAAVTAVIVLAGRATRALDTPATPAVLVP